MECQWYKATSASFQIPVLESNNNGILNYISVQYHCFWMSSVRSWNAAHWRQCQKCH